MQTRRRSLLESIVNIAIGYLVAVVSQMVIFPQFGIVTSIEDHLLIGLCFTLVSLVRSYTIRRVFTRWGHQTEVERYVTYPEPQSEEINPRAFNRTEIICLCGSTRFMDAFHEANRKFSLEGKIVLTVEIVTYDGATDPQKADTKQKQRLDELHLRKIDLANRVFVLNVDSYIGVSTQNEIDYAKSISKPIDYLEPLVKRVGLRL